MDLLTDVAVRPAASVMLLRDSDQGPEVLMVKRAARGPFPNLYVFPGGKVEASEQIADMEPRCIGLNDAEASRRLGLAEGGLVYWIAVARECFEETGILLATGPDGARIGDDPQQQERLREYRRRLNAGESSQMIEMCVKEDLYLQLSNITYSAHWITPKIEKKRFTTRFFVASMPMEQTPIHDGQEIVDSLWLTPQAALRASKEDDEMNMILPTLENLKTISGFAKVGDLLAARAAAQNIPAIQPKFVKIEGAWVGLLPDDPRYEHYDG